MAAGILARVRPMVLIGAVVGALLGALIVIALTPDSTRYQASADVALLPAPNLNTADSASFWEVLTSGQVSKTAAIVYQDADRWLGPAAQAAGVDPSELSLTAAEVPGTSIVRVTVEGPTGTAASTALEDVLRTADPQVAKVTAPFVVNVLWPAPDNAEQIAGISTTQVLVAGLFGGAIVGAGVGLLIATWARRQARSTASPAGSKFPVVADSPHKPGDLVDDDTPSMTGTDTNKVGPADAETVPSAGTRDSKRVVPGLNSDFANKHEAREDTSPNPLTHPEP
ncbi:YveK family protein [Gordonia bronchialis]|uniref:hypothetical protein n=1 Tax=Gordonia bronchialis TaxID=2054 RepID=UPI00227098F9|nr:hypothetical protein [Gordonia bronchialis]